MTTEQEQELERRRREKNREWQAAHRQKILAIREHYQAAETAALRAAALQVINNGGEVMTNEATVTTLDAERQKRIAEQLAEHELDWAASVLAEIDDELTRALDIMGWKIVRKDGSDHRWPHNGDSSFPAPDWCEVFNMP